MSPWCFTKSAAGLPHCQEPPAIIGHRGAPGKARENTLASFRAAWEEKADGIETDIRLTRDGHIVCHHDGAVSRGLGKPLEIASATLEEVRQAFGKSLSPDSQAPTLAQVLETVPPEKKFFIEIKCGPEIVPSLDKALAQSPLKPCQSVIIAFDPGVILAWKKARPDIKALWLSRYMLEKDPQWQAFTPEALAGTAARIRADGVSLKAQPALDKDLTRQLHEKGLEVHVWTVDGQTEAVRFRDCGVDSITSNRPGFIREALAGRP